MEKAIGIIIPVIADFVLSPEVLYGNELSGIYFPTQDEQYGRITFENLDAIKVCRGEHLPYNDDKTDTQEYPWIFAIQDSKWLKERFDYENIFYGDAYEFGGNVNEILTNFSHYLFQFHDQFVEVIARGFWFEKDENSLFKRALMEGHPFLELSNNNIERYSAFNITCQIRKNPKSNDALIADATFCTQKLLEFTLELEGNPTVDFTLNLFKRNGKIMSCFKGFLGKPIFEMEGIATLEMVKPYLDQKLYEISERRKAMGK